MKSIFTPLKTPPPSRERGVALLVTLAVLAMVTVLLVAFVSNVRTERTSSRAFSDQLKARLAAQAAIEQGIFDIRSMTQQSDYRTFVSNVVLTGSITNCITWFTNSTGTAGLVPGISYDYVNPSATPDSVNLNAQGYIYPLTMVPNLSIPWVYYSNSLVTTSVEAIRGMTRYAYWIDDESSKINVNTAGAANTNTTGRANLFDVSSVDLRGLPIVDQTRAQAIVTNRPPPYETVASLAQVGNGIDYTALYKTGITVFATVSSADYERQTNGLIRLNINAYTNTSAGAAVTNLVQDIGANLQVFSNKFGATLFQLAANIHDQITPGLIPTDSESNPWSLTGYLGVKNVPYLNEFAIDSYVYISTPAPPADSNFLIGVTNVVIWELFNLWKTPYYFHSNTLTCSSIPTVNLGGAVVSNMAGGTVSTYLNGGFVGNNSYIAFTNTTANGTILVSTNLAPIALTITFPASVGVTNLWGVTNGTTFYRLNIAAMPPRPLSVVAPAIMLTVPMVPPTMASNMFHAVVIAPGDPRVNKTFDRWDLGAARSFGSENIGYYLPNSASGDNNNPTDIATDGGFPFVGGPFLSPGFLGNVSYPTNVWMTLKLYGDGYSTFNALAVVPDWALLDIFTVNTPGARVAGKINVNSQRDLLADPNIQGALWASLAGIQIYTNVSTGAGAALPTTTSSIIYQAVTNIAENIPYQHIGEIAVKAGTLTNLGLAGAPQDTDERREAVVRALSGITTVRGNQFTIWGMGQSIQVVRGQTNVTGEAMIQAIVERTELFDNPPTHMTGATYRIKYLRNVTE